MKRLPTADLRDKLNSYERDDKETTFIRAWLKERRMELVKALATSDVMLQGEGAEKVAQKVVADALAANPDGMVRSTSPRCCSRRS